MPAPCLAVGLSCAVIISDAKEASRLTEWMSQQLAVKTSTPSPRLLIEFGWQQVVHCKLQRVFLAHLLCMVSKNQGAVKPSASEKKLLRRCQPTAQQRSSRHSRHCAN